MATQVSLNSGAIASAGALAIQTNGTTQAVSISTGQVATLAQNPILTSGTANGVAYLNGSKAVTSGSALVFDGTNLGVGVTPSAWNNIFKAVQINAQGCLMATSATMQMGNNIFYDGAYKFIGTGYANRYYQATGQHVWTVSTASGSAGGAITETQAMTLDANGRLGIGPTSPSTVLHTSSSIAGIFAQGTSTKTNNYLMTCSNSYNYGVVGVVSGDNTSGGDIYALGYVSSAGGSFNPVASWTSSGNLLVGKTSTADNVVGFLVEPTGRVVATSSASTSAANTFIVYSTGASAYRFYVGMDGTINATSIVITAISDQRLKENVRDIDTGLNEIMSLKPRRFDWKEGKGQDKKNVAGFIAQEFEDVFPECVSTSKAGADGIEYKNINHETLIPTLVKAIQEQQSLITQLTARITALEGA